MTKKEKRNLVKGFLALFLLAGIYSALLLWQRGEQEKQVQKEMQEVQEKTLLSLDTKKIRQIRISQEEEVLLEKTGEGYGSPDDPYFKADENRMKRMEEDLAELEMSRKLTDPGDLADYGLASPKLAITVTMEDGEEHQIRVGNHSDSRKELYIQVDDPDEVYLTSAALDEHFSGSLNQLAAYEDFPVIQARLIREIRVERESDPYLLTTPGDDTCTVTDAAGSEELADVSLVGTIQMNLSNLSWLRNVEYNCTDPAIYGLDEPKVTIRIVRSASGKGNPEREETVLFLGDRDDSGNYYASLSSSTQVHVIRGEYLEALAEGASGSFRSKNYSFVSIGDLDHLDVKMNGETYMLRRVSEDGRQTDDALTWYVDDVQVSKDAFTDFYYACVSVTAQERLDTVPEETGESLLELHYYLTDGTEKQILYYPGDQNFCTVIYDNGTKAASTNRLYVSTMLESFDRLVSEADQEPSKNEGKEPGDEVFTGN